MESEDPKRYDGREARGEGLHPRPSRPEEGAREDLAVRAPRTSRTHAPAAENDFYRGPVAVAPLYAPHEMPYKNP